MKSPSQQLLDEGRTIDQLLKEYPVSRHKRLSSINEALTPLREGEIDKLSDSAIKAIAAGSREAEFDKRAVKGFLKAVRAIEKPLELINDSLQFGVPGLVSHDVETGDFGSTKADEKLADRVLRAIVERFVEAEEALTDLTIRIERSK